MKDEISGCYSVRWHCSSRYAGKINSVEKPAHEVVVEQEEAICTQTTSYDLYTACTLTLLKLPPKRQSHDRRRPIARPVTSPPVNGGAEAESIVVGLYKYRGSDQREHSSHPPRPLNIAVLPDTGLCSTCAQMQYPQTLAGTPNMHRLLHEVGTADVSVGFKQYPLGLLNSILVV